MHTLRLLFFTALLGFASSLPAQIIPGLKGGLNLASMAQENGPDIQYAIAGIGGLTFDLNLWNHFTLQPELLFIQKGSKTRYEVLGLNFEQIITLNYLEIPVLAKVRFGNYGDDEDFGVYAAIGPWAGFALNGKSRTTQFLSTGIRGDSTVEEFQFDASDNRKRFDYGACAAVGLAINRIILEGRYNYGLAKVLPASTGTDTTPVQQTRGISVTLGVVF
ncbi:MAG: porin family protein [Saprospiraceae bacterium]